MNIRKCEAKDEKIWITLNREFMDFEIQEDGVWNNTQDEPDTIFMNTFREAVNNPELVTLFLFEQNETIMGFANLMTIYSIWAHGKALVLDDLYIREEYRGKGFGKEAMKFLVTYGRIKGYKRLQFQSEFSNASAMTFYKKLGFTPVDMHFYIKHL
ncbi:MAG: GNAT family N-acetyltransferase [Anaerovoracaceae bacterium]